MLPLLLLVMALACRIACATCAHVAARPAALCGAQADHCARTNRAQNQGGKCWGDALFWSNVKMSNNESFEAVVEVFDRPGGWYYVAVPKSLCQPYHDLQERGLIAVMASASQNDAQITWKTSLLPMGDGSHFLALPAKARNRLGIGAGARVKMAFSIRRR
ncbi:MAG: DUF1905 domain-containing protein [Burkholderiaceae bacterium]|nr:DUF1905 domain-containing protein [Burkholderiaceae bacterium]